MTCYPLREEEYSESEVITLFNQKFFVLIDTALIDRLCVAVVMSNHSGKRQLYSAASHIGEVSSTITFKSPSSKQTNKYNLTKYK